MEENPKKENFPREVGILHAALKGEIKDTRLLGWVRERCKDHQVLLGVTMDLKRRGVPVEPQWISRIITECILEINRKVDSPNHQLRVG